MVTMGNWNCFRTRVKVERRTNIVVVDVVVDDVVDDDVDDVVDDDDDDDKPICSMSAFVYDPK